MNAFEKNLRFLAGTSIGNSNLLFPLNYYREKCKSKIIYPDSDCCIEGFQRSGNSFFFILFKRKNKSVKIAHHMHASEQLIRAIKYNVPRILLIREPIEVVASLLAWDTKLKIRTALKAYISFHKKLMPYVQQLFIVSFEDVTAKPVDVVQAFNTRFETNFVLPEYTDEQLDTFKERVLSRNIATSSPLPTPEKDKLKEGFRVQIKNHSVLTEAIKVYEQIYEHRHQF